VSQKRNLAVIFGCIIAAFVAYGATYPRFHPPHPLATVTPPSLPLLPTNPLSWEQLPAAQRLVLLPFAAEWDTFSDARKRKWLKIASRYAKMSTTAQRRLHARMVEWIRMTPEQRRVARENYLVSKKLPAQTRENAWRAYQQLPQEQKEKLAAATEKQPIVISAPSADKIASDPRPADYPHDSRASTPFAASNALIPPPVNSVPLTSPEAPVLFHGS